jgi:large subunit ribosomal protein L30
MSDRQLKVTLVRSLSGQLANIAASARGLGLRRIRQSVTVKDTPENRGMIEAAVHLLKVESDGAVQRAAGKGA